MRGSPNETADTARGRPTPWSTMARTLGATIVVLAFLAIARSLRQHAAGNSDLDDAVAIAVVGWFGWLTWTRSSLSRSYALGLLGPLLVGLGTRDGLIAVAVNAAAAFLSRRTLRDAYE
jgi:hypothetical protein